MLVYKHSILWTLRDHVLDIFYKFLLFLAANLFQRKAFALLPQTAPFILIYSDCRSNAFFLREVRADIDVPDVQLTQEGHQADN